MAFEEILQSLSMEAAADLKADQYRFVTISGNKTVARVATAGVRALGVNQGNTEQVGQAVQVGIAGVSKIEAGGTVNPAANFLVTTDDQGRAVPATTAGHQVLGYAITGGAVGELISVFLCPAGVV